MRAGATERPAEHTLRRRGRPRDGETCDALIIGAGMSGLAAAIRLAQFGKRVLIVERHTVWGGLNSFFKRGGHHFDTGLHAVTNWLPPDYRGPRRPLARVCRQLRIRPAEFELDPQRYSQIVFPGVRLCFENGLERLTDEIRTHFPDQVDGFARVVAAFAEYPAAESGGPFRSGRAFLEAELSDPLLVEMLLCPLLFYGSAWEHDVDLDQLAILFNSIYVEGFGRPKNGVRTVIDTLVRQLELLGVEIWRGAGVDRIEVSGDAARAVVLEGGQRILADQIYSSAGLVETLRMRSDQASAAAEDAIGALSFTETSFVLARPPAAFGFDATISFYSETPRFRFARAAEPVDFSSGVICCPSNFRHAEPVEPLLRVTHLADHGAWSRLAEADYAEQKKRSIAATLRHVAPITGSFADDIVYVDAFTPRTVLRFTGHLHGAVYGSPDKRRDGRTDLGNLFLIGTDQGLLGIIGAMHSGISIANAYGLRS